MQCDEFRADYGRSGNLSAGEYRAWVDHMNRCAACGEWYMTREVERWGGRVSDFPCVHVAYYATLRSPRYADPRQCPDCLVIRRADGSYAIPVHDGGSAASAIRYCPWCGIELGTAAAPAGPRPTAPPAP